MSSKPKTRVCVLSSSYDDSSSDMKDYEGDLVVTPAHYFAADGSADYEFTQVPLIKKTVYAELRALIKSERFDVFFNLCDGAKDEDRAGEEVVTTLEEFQVPFTGALAKHYELTKPEMKMLAYYSGIRSARFAVVEKPGEIEGKCQGLTFPVIVKHISGYSSIGMTKDCKCQTMAALVARASAFILQFQAALVEEFVDGEEVTVLACADPTQPDGIRVYPPVRMTFPEGEDFKHFSLKWEAFDGMAWSQVPAEHPAMASIVEIGRTAFKTMMGGAGYGRTDLRINAAGEAVFLEINPNCGIMYPPEQEGSADWILKLAGPTGHSDFARLQIAAAVARCELKRPLYEISFSDAKGYFLRAKKAIPAGTVVFNDEGQPVRLFTKSYVEGAWDAQSRAWFRQSAYPLSDAGAGKVYAVMDMDPARWRPYNHACNPTLAFAGDHSLCVVAVADLAVGDELTLDYGTFCDATMTPFECKCGAAQCRKTISFKEQLAPRGNSPLNNASAPAAFAVGPTCN
jgi:D-alanine-D-alanine ligase-like ATP-grasp enzyme